jgi:hypothetical protein
MIMFVYSQKWPTPNINTGSVWVGHDADYSKIEHLSNIDEIQHGYSAA